MNSENSEQLTVKKVTLRFAEEKEFENVKIWGCGDLEMCGFGDVGMKQSRIDTYC